MKEERKKRREAMGAFKEGRINHNEKENDMPPESPCGNLTFFISWESSQPFCT